MRHPMLRSPGRVLAIGLAGVLVFSACGGDARGKGREAQGKEKASAGGTPVNIVNFVFDPQELQVPAGTKVTWTNQDDAPHNVQDVSDLNTPISPELKKGETFSITYSKPGTYAYVCGLHTYMTGTVNVM